MSENELVLGGRYRLGRLLGHGGMAEVYLAEDTRLHRTVAVKVLRSDLARDDSFQERFRREAQSAAALNHPSIVAVYDTGEEHQTSVTGAEMTIPYIVMEYVQGTTLREHIDPEHPMDAAKAGEIMAALLSALEYSHRAGIVHRDIKPGNVMITDTGAVKVMDFGIARAVADATSAMTATQAVMGTAQYLSPEQARGQLVDARSDIYSAACVMFEMLTGRPPFTGDTPVSIAYQHVREDPAAPSAYNPAVTPAMDAVILTGLAKDREERYPSAVAFSRDIAAVVSGREPRLVGGAVPVGAEAEETTVLGSVEDSTDSIPVTGPTAVLPAAAGVAAGVGMASAGSLSTGSPTPAGSPAPHPAQEVEEEEPKRPWWLLILVIVAVLALLGALLWYLDPFGSDGPEQVAVPALAGETQEDAETLLDEAGLEGEYTEEASEDVEAGTVISSDPGEGQEVDAGSTVAVTVSAGPSPVDVPDVTGMSESEAESALEEVGLSMTVAGEEDQAGTEADEVIRSDPRSGDTATPGEEVEVWVATGNYTVPNVVGQTQESATEMLESAGFEVDVTEAESEDATAGTVTSQTPPAESSQAVGSTVQIVVAAEPGPVTVPNVTGRTEEDARQVLGDAGFGISTEREASDSVAEGSVIRTDPEANSEVEEGATITLVLSTGPEETEEPTTPEETTTEETTTEEEQTTEEETTQEEQTSEEAEDENAEEGGDE